MAELTIRAFFNIGDKIIPIEEMEPERLEEVKQNMLKRFSEGMSEYYSQHPDEFIKLGQVSNNSAEI